jgi:hypothetical protein
MNTTPAKIGAPLAGSLCWTKERPFQPASLLLVLARQETTAAVVELPLTAVADDGGDTLEEALKKIQPNTLMAVSQSKLGPPVARLTEAQYRGVREHLAGWKKVGAA